jgi:hypothetical protein
MTFRDHFKPISGTCEPDKQTKYPPPGLIVLAWGTEHEGRIPAASSRSVEKVNCRDPIESAQVGSILDGTIPAPLPNLR